MVFKYMETKGQELKKMEKTLKTYVRDQTEKLVERQEKAMKEQSEKLEERQEKAMKDLHDNQEWDMEEMKTMLLELQVAVKGSPTQNLGPSSAICTRREPWGNRVEPPKLTRLEFPNFNGDKLDEWLYHCEQYFEYDETAEGMKVKVATIHLEGKTLQWHQNFMHNRLRNELPGWEEYIEAISARFGDDLHADPMAELKNLKQSSTVQVYLDKFDELMTKVFLSEDYTVSCFLGGLREEV